MTVLPVLLFDIDGVLITPGGYRKSYLDTVRSFFDQFGCDPIELDHSIPERFEFHEITAEWDMVPLTIAAFLNWVGEATPDRLPFVRLDAIHDLNGIQGKNPFADYLSEKIPQLRLATDDRLDYPASAVFEHCQRLKGDSVFQAIWDDPVLEELLADALNVQTSQTYQRLETFILGSGRFYDCFGFSPLKNIVSNLETADLPILSLAYRQKITKMAGETIFVSGMTARPNLAPVELGLSNSRLTCALPEAEIAIQVLGWDQADIPIIGAGTMNYFEREHGKPMTYWLKPHPVHALAAIFTALKIPTRAAFELAIALGSEDQAHSIDDLCRMIPEDTIINVFVFEDSPSGIVSATRAVKLLEIAGCSIDFHPYGIYTTPEREQQLRSLKAAICNNINEALDNVFSKILKFG